MVIAVHPKYCLSAGAVEGIEVGWWFRLETEDGERVVDASDTEPGLCADRLALVALVRGLESVEQSCSLAIRTSNRYVQHGLVFGLDDWRARDWRWENFGSLVRIKHEELWRRVDRALSYHQIESVDLQTNGRAVGPGLPSGGRFTPTAWIRPHGADRRMSGGRPAAQEDMRRRLVRVHRLDQDFLPCDNTLGGGHAKWERTGAAGQWSAR